MKKPITLISTISILMFAAALTWFSAGIYRDYSQKKIENKNTFETLVLKTKLAADEYKTGTPEFSGRFLKAISDIDSYSKLNVTVNGRTIYAYPPQSFQLPSSGLVKQYSETVKAADGASITVTADLYQIKSSSIYNYSRLSALLILAGTLVSFLLLIILREPSAKKKEEEEKPFEIDYGHSFDELNEEEIDIVFDETSETDNKTEADSDDDSFFNDTNFFENEETDNLTIPSLEENQLSLMDKNPEDPFSPTSYDEASQDFDLEDYEDEDENDADTILVDSSDEDFMNEDSDNDEDSTSIEEENTENTETEDFSAFQQEFDFDAPVEEVSPITGLKLQSALNNELDETIKDVISENKDLTIALLKVNGLDRGNSISTSVISKLKENIPESRQIFEYNSDGYAIILKNMDLNSCVEIFDNIYQNISDYLKENNAANEVTIGISSVNMRDVDAQRLIKEADQALAHAIEDPDSPIIAFRANPEKYKEFIENN